MVSDTPTRRNNIRKRRRRTAKNIPSYLWVLQLIVAILTFVYLIELYTIGIVSISPVLGIAAIIASALAALFNLMRQYLPLLAIDVILTIVLIIHVNNLLF